jgi:thiol-disulfide isomerase/thioredoxin
MKLPDSSFQGPVDENRIKKSFYYSRRRFLSALAAAGASASLVRAQAASALGMLAPVVIDNPLGQYPARDWEKVYRNLYKSDSTFTFLCAPNDTHNCLLHAHVKNGVVTRISPTYAFHKATDLEGNPVDASVFASAKLTMVNVWATFCSPCVGEMPELSKIAQEYKDQGLQVIGLVVDVTDKATLQDAPVIITETGANYLHILPSDELYSELGGIDAVPTTFFVDSQGRTYFPSREDAAYVGARSKKEWEEIINAQLEKLS